MAGFATLAAFRDAQIAEQILKATWWKTGTTLTSGAGESLWRVGFRPAAGADPATTPGTAISNQGIWFPNTSTVQKYLTKVVLHFTTGSGIGNGTFILYDRLVGVSGISMVGTGSKTINSAALPRYTSGLGVGVYLETTTAIVGSPVVRLLSYTDQDGNTGATTSVTLGSSATQVNQLWGPMPLAAGDYGVRAVSTINVDTAGTAGVVNVLLLKPILQIPFATTNLGSFPPSEIGMPLPFPKLPRIYDGASLMFGSLAATQSITWDGEIQVTLDG